MKTHWLGGATEPVTHLLRSAGKKIVFSEKFLGFTLRSNPIDDGRVAGLPRQWHPSSLEASKKDSAGAESVYSGRNSGPIRMSV